jgi:DNA-binding GntR family transcriptional regulator
MPLPSTLERLDREPSRELIYRQLKALILDLTLQPLEILRDTDLAARLGVSRTPVREALRKLEDEGLVQSQPNQWTRVSAIDLHHLLEIYPVAQALHVTALRLAFELLERADIQTLRITNDAMEEAIARHQPAEALKLDASFHGLIVARAANPVLSHLVASLTEKLQRIELAHFSRVQSGTASAAEHRALIRAIRARDLDEAIRQMTLNWDCPDVADVSASKATGS